MKTEFADVNATRKTVRVEIPLPSNESIIPTVPANAQPSVILASN